jgi:hypothetical protein
MSAPPTDFQGSVTTAYKPLQPKITFSDTSQGVLPFQCLTQGFQTIKVHLSQLGIILGIPFEPLFVENKSAGLTKLTQ